MAGRCLFSTAAARAFTQSNSLLASASLPRLPMMLPFKQTSTAVPHAATAAAVRHIGCGMNTCNIDLNKTPPKILVEYDPQHVDAFIELADAIEDAFPSMLVEGNEEGEGRPGSFEVLAEDGTSLFSRLSMKAAPKTEDIIALIASRQVKTAEAA